MSLGRLSAWILVLTAAWLVSANAGAVGAASPSRTPTKPGPTARSAPKSASSPAAKGDTQRARKDLGTLDEINIEGEISVPQVLFITARDRARFHDPLYRLYLKSGTELGSEITFPLPRGARPCP